MVTREGKTGGFSCLSSANPQLVQFHSKHSHCGYDTATVKCNSGVFFLECFLTLTLLLYSVVLSLPSAHMCSEGTVVGSVCLSVTLHLTSRVFVRLTKDTTYLTGNEGQKFRTVFSETAPLQS